MVRVKRGIIAHKRREKLLTHTKGFKWGRKTKERLAHEALLHAWTHSYVGRKRRKRDFRRLWQTRIGGSAKAEGFSYSTLISALHKKRIALDRKVLAELARTRPATFAQLVQSIR